ncbi:hypothetical protein CASFOL_005647 [Castilleja foliolosa]|uniref:Protein kinase domain-containing protein n=1 Tax=Castilleja foliolosa TaxID=1961234 RepID=A0ABD3E541_9LAMI
MIVITTLVWLLSTPSLTHAAQSDIDCLKAVKASLHDPSNYLESWDFNNGSRSFICYFTGIECWHERDNSVINIKLASMGLSGEFPLGVSNCQAMTGLDLSNNNLHGQIPNNISSLFPYITNLDLSSNRFSGNIPASLANCSFLNTLRLDNNQLTGQIPLPIGQLGRMKTFSVSNNQLSGPIPNFSNSTIGADNYANNAGLCGAPLPGCRGPPDPDVRNLAIIGAAAGCPLGFAIGFWLTLRAQSTNNNEKKKLQQKEGPFSNKWARSIKGAKRIKVSIFEKKSLPRMSLNDLMKATNDFSDMNIIRTGRTGTTYKAILQDGTSLMVKRFQDTQIYSEKEFISGMPTLGNCKHRNLVPLLGFCSTKKERFLIYKHMPNGTLHDKLHIINEGDEIMDWPLRLKIATGAAKVLAWLNRTSLVHWNISSKCVFLDSEYEPKILVPADLMMNPVADQDRSGYVGQENATRTPEGDVYSFGVMLLELVTREKPAYIEDSGDLVEWISQLSSMSNLGEAIDGFLVGKGFYSEIFRVLEVACNCVLSGRQERPTMFEVYQLLGDIGQRYEFAIEDEVYDHQIVEVIEHH